MQSSRFSVLLALVVLGRPTSIAFPADPPPTPASAPAPRGHAHNDYEHPRPLLDALDHGYSSVEADIYLVDGKLLVGHNLADLRPARTLEALYLAPLAKRVRENGGQVHRGGSGFLLLIDLKSEAETTYTVLQKALEKHADMLTTVRGGVEEKRAVTIVLSGERPRETLRREEVRRASYDGRLEDLESKEPSHFLPLISDNWTKHFRWRGEGAFPDEERRKLADIVKKAHDKGRLVRFWSTSDTPAVWAALHDAGVDLINVDNLEGLERFLQERRKPAPPGEKGSK